MKVFYQKGYDPKEVVDIYDVRIKGWIHDLTLYEIKLFGGKILVATDIESDDLGNVTFSLPENF